MTPLAELKAMDYYYGMNQNELAELRKFLHERCEHPYYEYATTTGPRKAWDCHKPEGDGWEVNKERGDNGWERFDYHEEAYWRRMVATEDNELTEE